jgi:NADPH-dependent ferric siderophore reductase
MRVTLGGGDIARFRPMGYDQWFRLFLPVGGEEGLERIPAKANRMLGYLRFLRIPEGQRPAMRSYTVRAYREDGEHGAEIDVDFVVHAAADGSLGPAPQWAVGARPGEDVAILDEGLAFNPERGTDRVVLVADETGLPAVSGVCASLPDDAEGLAIVEAPTADDALDGRAPTPRAGPRSRQGRHQLLRLLASRRRREQERLIPAGSAELDPAPAS